MTASSPGMAAQQLHLPELPLREIMDGLSPSIFVGLLTPDGKLVYANRPALEVVGGRLEDLIGQDFAATPWWNHSESARRRLHAAIGLACSGVASRFDKATQDCRGNLITTDFSLLPLFDADGSVVYLIASGRDVTERQQAQRALRLTQFAVDHAHDAMFKVRADGRLRYVNDAACRLIGQSRDTLLGVPIHEICMQITATAWPLQWSELKARGSLHFASRLRQSSGREIPVDVSVSFLEYEGEEISFVYARDLSERVAAQERLRHLGSHDMLTGLPTRALLRSQLEQALLVAERFDSDLALMCVGLDRLKRVNATLGHGAGDEVLRVTAERIGACLRKADTLSRIGGDEFVVLMPADAQAALSHVAQRILSAVAQPVAVETREVFITCSIGAVVAPGDDTDIDGLLKKASAALGRAKSRGGNALHLHTRDIASQEPERLALESGLRKALARSELHLHYQPQVDLRDGSMVGVEALLRWQHPEFGNVSPAHFIPIAEETGLILPIGDWVLRTACETAAGWQRMGLAPVRMSVNLSPRQLQQDDLARRIETILIDTGVAPQHFGVEVTESTLIDNFEHAARTLGQLRALGIEIALDDFGTGYSSLGYLRRLPIDVVKVDRSLVPDVAAPSEDVSITRAIITMAHSLHMKVIAEGVESEGQLAMLVANQCDLIQGYYFSRPVSADQIEGMLIDAKRLPAALLDGALRSRTLLIVDPECSVIAALRRLLSRDGYHILSAENGAEALQRLAEHPIDVIISEQRMPGMSGVEFLRRAKALCPRAMRILLSGHLELESIAEAINEGAISKFLTKPWDERSLRAHVEESFRHKDMLDERRRVEVEVQAANRELVHLNERHLQVLQTQRDQMQRDQMGWAMAQDLLDNIPAALIGFDDAGTVAFMNSDARHLFGSPAELHGRHASQLFNAALLDVWTARDGVRHVVTIGSRRYQAVCRPLKESAHAQRRLLALTPFNGSQALA
jgi:diguanylate cyclase (GGDEF)-like protein/PAS domain S-box-containing protein